MVYDPKTGQMQTVGSGGNTGTPPGGMGWPAGPQNTGTPPGGMGWPTATAPPPTQTYAPGFVQDTSTPEQQFSYLFGSIMPQYSGAQQSYLMNAFRTGGQGAVTDILGNPNDPGMAQVSGVNAKVVPPPESPYNDQGQMAAPPPVERPINLPFGSFTPEEAAARLQAGGMNPQHTVELMAALEFYRTGQVSPGLMADMERRGIDTRPYLPQTTTQAPPPVNPVDAYAGQQATGNASSSAPAPPPDPIGNQAAPGNDPPADWQGDVYGFEPPANEQLPQLAGIHQNWIDVMEGRADLPEVQAALAEMDISQEEERMQLEQSLAVRGMAQSTQAEYARNRLQQKQRAERDQRRAALNQAYFQSQIPAVSQMYQQGASARGQSLGEFMQFYDRQFRGDQAQEANAREGLRLMMNLMGINAMPSGMPSVSIPPPTAGPGASMGGNILSSYLMNPGMFGA